jgi:hypothetical protein
MKDPQFTVKETSSRGKGKLVWDCSDIECEECNLYVDTIAGCAMEELIENTDVKKVSAALVAMGEVMLRTPVDVFTKEQTHE